MTERSRQWVEHEAKIEVKCIAHVRFVVDADREAENFEIVQRDANEATL